jgi:hypothetical protein
VLVGVLVGVVVVVRGLVVAVVGVLVGGLAVVVVGVLCTENFHFFVLLHHFKNTKF